MRNTAAMLPLDPIDRPQHRAFFHDAFRIQLVRLNCK